jgi:hypothetical protein
MVNAGLKKEMENLIASFHGGKQDQFDLGYELEYDDTIAKRILDFYLPTANGASDDLKKKCLEIMKRSCDEDHSKLADWQGAMENLIIFGLMPTTSYQEASAIVRPKDITKSAISSIIRFSRWYHTESNFWKRFEPYARKIGNLLWKNMEKLNKYNA